MPLFKRQRSESMQYAQSKPSVSTTPYPSGSSTDRSGDAEYTSCSEPATFPQSPAHVAKNAYQEQQNPQHQGKLILNTNSGAGSYQRTQRIGAIAIRNVRFADQALLYPNDRTEEEVQDAWYSGDELDVFKKERRDLVKQLKRVNFDLSQIDQTHTSLRGFEPYFSMEINKATKSARSFVYHVVFGEQERQRMLNIVDREALRELAAQASDWACASAMQLGYKDALECHLESLLFFQERCSISP
jgi:hypothetical protein|uniref:Uncharacterized protein n=1 Tax=Phaeodactylum tricornutum TaxID=2850 RepID=A0A8J9TGA5_PHATR